MTRLPYMPYYVVDITAATAAMTDEQFGAYQRLLNYAWLHNGLPADEQEIREIRRWSAAAWRRIWPTVSRKWIARNGRLVNERQEQERVKVNRRASAGRINVETRWARERPAAIENCDTTVLPTQNQRHTKPYQPDTTAIDPHIQSTDTDPKKDCADAQSSRGRARLTPLIARMNGDIAYPWRVPFPGRLWAEFIAKLGGSENAAEARLTAWVQSVIAKYPADAPIPDAGDSWGWWRRQSVSLFPRAPVVSAKSQATRDALAEFNRRHS